METIISTLRTAMGTLIPATSSFPNFLFQATEMKEEDHFDCRCDELAKSPNFLIISVILLLLIDIVLHAILLLYNHGADLRQACRRHMRAVDDTADLVSACTKYIHQRAVVTLTTVRGNARNILRTYLTNHNETVAVGKDKAVVNNSKRLEPGEKWNRLDSKNGEHICGDHDGDILHVDGTVGGDFEVLDEVRF